MKDLTGQKFGRLTVVEFAGKRKGYAYWKCKCDCGNEIEVYSHSLIKGTTQSCGCIHHEVMVRRNTTHGLCHSKTYRAWRHMNHRCFNENDKNFPNYGGREITVCDEWHKDFVAFYNYVSQLEHFDEEGYSLDRINVNGNYEPGNVRRATKKEQGRNKRNNIIVEYNGEKMPLTEAAERAGIDAGTLRARHYSGRSDKQLFAPSDQSIAFEALKQASGFNRSLDESFKQARR